MHDFKKLEISRQDLARINVIGVSGSGKSTLATKLANLLGYKVIQLDGLYHEANWVEADVATFRERLKNELDADCWIIDGNYHSKVHDLKWEQATLVIWLDLSFSRTLWQAISRAINRAWTKEELWGTGNRESFRRSFFSKESVVLWTITSYSRVRQRYAKIMQDPQWSHIKFIRLKNRHQLATFISKVQKVVDC